MAQLMTRREQRSSRTHDNKGSDPLSQPATAPSVVGRIEAIGCDKTHMWQVEEHAESEILCDCLQWSQRSDYGVNGIFVVFRQVLAKGSGRMMSTLQNAERLQSIQRRVLEGFPIKVRMHEADVMREALDCFLVEEVSKGHPLLNRMRGRREAWLAHWLQGPSIRMPRTKLCTNGSYATYNDSGVAKSVVPLTSNTS